MAGRGRGKGKGMSFSVETLGFGRGEAMPKAILQPPPLFPPLEFKPVPLCATEEYDYLRHLKQELRQNMRESPYFIKVVDKKHDIDRYSDKYQMGQGDNSDNWEPDWSKLPAELKVRVRKRKMAGVAQPKVTIPRIHIKQEHIDKQLEELEKLEAQTGDGEERVKEEGEKEDEEPEEEDDFYDEEEMEEETDYIQSYFDNGEGFGFDEDDDLDDGPTY